MFNNKHLLRQLTVLLLFILAGGTVGYTLVEDGWSLFDGFYMTLITLTTIGFGEVHTLSPAGRLLTVAIIVFGLGAAATIISQLAQLIMEGNLFAVWRSRRMEKRIARMKNHVIVCGFGRIGQAICHDLTNMGVQCVIVDREDNRVGFARDANIPVLAGNATADQALLGAGVERATILVAALSNDSDNLFVALAARDLNPNLMVIARGEDKSIETRMLRAGVDRVVYPAQLGGGQIARLIGSELGHDRNLDERRRPTDVMGYELQVHRDFNKGGTTVGDILAKTGALRVVTHVDAEDVRHIEPATDHLVGEGDAVVLVCEVMAAPVAHDDQLAELPPNLAVGIPVIDEEHRRILTMIRRLDESGSRHDRRTVQNVLQDLREYTERHFRHEEALLASAGYPEAEAHVAEHRALTARVDRLTADGSRLQVDDLRATLDSWLRHHILEVDRHYADFLATSHGSGASTAERPAEVVQS